MPFVAFHLYFTFSSYLCEVSSSKFESCLILGVRLKIPASRFLRFGVPASHRKHAHTFSDAMFVWQEAEVVKHPLVQAADDLKSILDSGAVSDKATDGALRAAGEAIVKACASSLENRSVFGEAGGLESLSHLCFQLSTHDEPAHKLALAALFDAVRCLCTRHGTFPM